VRSRTGPTSTWQAHRPPPLTWSTTAPALVFPASGTPQPRADPSHTPVRCAYAQLLYTYRNTGDTTFLDQAVSPDFRDNTLPTGRPSARLGPPRLPRRSARIPDLNLHGPTLRHRDAVFTAPYSVSGAFHTLHRPRHQGPAGTLNFIQRHRHPSTSAARAESPRTALEKPSPSCSRPAWSPIDRVHVDEAVDSAFVVMNSRDRKVFEVLVVPGQTWSPPAIRIRGSAAALNPADAV